MFTLCIVYTVLAFNRQYYARTHTFTFIYMCVCVDSLKYVQNENEITQLLEHERCRTNIRAHIRVGRRVCFNSIVVCVFNRFLRNNYSASTRIIYGIIL